MPSAEANRHGHSPVSGLFVVTCQLHAMYVGCHRTVQKCRSKVKTTLSVTRTLLGIPSTRYRYRGPSPSAHPSRICTCGLRSPPSHRSGTNDYVWDGSDATCRVAWPWERGTRQAPRPMAAGVVSGRSTRRSIRTRRRPSLTGNDTSYKFARTAPSLIRLQSI